MVYFSRCSFANARSVTVPPATMANCSGPAR